MFKLLFLLMPVLLIRCSAPDVRNVRWGMTMDEVTANESASWKDEPSIIEIDKDGGSTIIAIANVDIFAEKKTLLVYKFESAPKSRFYFYVKRVKLRV